MGACIDLRKLVRAFGPNIESVILAPSPSAAVEEEALGKLFDCVAGFQVAHARAYTPCTVLHRPLPHR